MARVRNTSIKKNKNITTIALLLWIVSRELNSAKRIENIKANETTAGNARLNTINKRFLIVIICQLSAWNDSKAIYFADVLFDLDDFPAGHGFKGDWR